MDNLSFPMNPRDFYIFFCAILGFSPIFFGCFVYGFQFALWYELFSFFLLLDGAAAKPRRQCYGRAIKHRIESFIT